MSVTTLLSEEEFLNLPEAPGRQEFRDGELIELQPAKLSHSELVMRLLDLLRASLHSSRIWIETGFQLRKNRRAASDARRISLPSTANRCTRPMPVAAAISP